METVGENYFNQAIIHLRAAGVKKLTVIHNGDETDPLTPMCSHSRDSFTFAGFSVHEILMMKDIDDNNNDAFPTGIDYNLPFSQWPPLLLENIHEIAKNVCGSEAIVMCSWLVGSRRYLLEQMREFCDEGSNIPKIILGPSHGLNETITDDLWNYQVVLRDVLIQLMDFEDDYYNSTQELREKFKYLEDVGTTLVFFGLNCIDLFSDKLQRQSKEEYCKKRSKKQILFMYFLHLLYSYIYSSQTLSSKQC